MKLFKYSLLLLSLFLAGSVFGAYPTTPDPSSVTETSIEFIVIPSEDNISDIGFLIGTDPNDLYSLDTCGNLIPHSTDFLTSGNQYRHSINNLKPSTKYYYNLCYYTDNDTESSYLVDKEKSFTTLSNSGDKVETIDARNITESSAEIGLKVLGGTTVISGFRYSEIQNKLNTLSCIYENSGSHVVNSYKRKMLSGLVEDTSYYFQSCVKDTSGNEKLGRVKSFKTSNVTSNDLIEKCNIDYVEFSPKNNTNILQGPEYDNFVNAQGRSVDLIIHPKNASDCKNIKIKDIFIEEINNKKSYHVISSGKNRFFSENGTFTLPLVAGDQYCGSDGICNYGVGIWYGGFQNGGKFSSKEFYSYGPLRDRNNAYQNQVPSTNDKNKGLLEYEKRSGTKAWKIRTTSDPAHIPGRIPTYNYESPCYKKTLNYGAGGYDDNCYEFLAPLPGLGVAQKDASGNKTGRYSIEDLGSFQLGEYINTVFEVALGILMVLAVIMIIIAGVEYMTVESIYGKSDAKKRITGAITGLILALGIFVILKTINPELLKINFGENINEVSIETVESFGRTDEGVGGYSEAPGFTAGELSPGIKKIKSKIESGIKIKKIYVEGTTTRQKSGRAYIELTDGTTSESFPVGFGVSGINPNNTKGSNQTPVGEWSLGSSDYRISTNSTNSVWSNSKVEGNYSGYGPAFIWIDEPENRALAIHGKSNNSSDKLGERIDNYIGYTLGCVRIRNEDLELIKNSFNGGVSRINISIGSKIPEPEGN
ncbi:MAG: hypothetical protein ACI870_000462 [Crocinitomicaceae bacterium]|jgi:hypothetical protein